MKLKNLEGLIMISFLNPTAKPKVSKPGPKFAEVAGTLTNIFIFHFTQRAVYTQGLILHLVQDHEYFEVM